MRRLISLVGVAAVLAVTLIAGAGTTSAADHGDAPLAKANHALDIADVYVFGGQNGRVVLAMTVNPLTMPGDTPTFDTAGLYQFKVDTNDDAVPDVSYNITFGTPDGDGSQTVTVRRAEGPQADELSDGGADVVTGSTTPKPGAPAIGQAGSSRVFAGLRDDPFFFDLNAFKAGLAFRNPGNNFFAGLNVSAIVLELAPTDFLGNQGDTTAGVWAVTSKNGTVVDRMGRPAIATVFIPADQKDNFNQTKPVDDVTKWKSTVVGALQSLKADPALADALLPDILTFDLNRPFGFLNGRQLSDDVIDAELQLITKNPAASDNVASDSAFTTSFPYLAPANTAAAPTAVPAGSPSAAPAGGSPTARPPVTPPNTGTGDASDGGVGMTLWIVLAVAGAAAVVGGGAIAVRARGR